MNELQVFKNEEFGQVRTVEINGEPWFVGKDICQHFGDSNHNRTLSRVDDQDKTTTEIIDSLGRKQNATVVNESGLYSILFAMQPQKANNGGAADAYPIEQKERIEKIRRFKRWITSEVIPSIRKNGGYIADQENLTPEQIVANALVVAQNIIANKDKQIEVMKPKAEYFDALVERNLLTSFRDTAKELGVGERFFIKFLIDNRYIYRDQKKQLKPYSDKNKGLFEVKEYNSRYSEHSGLQTLLTPKGRETFRLLLAEEDEIFE